MDVRSLCLTFEVKSHGPAGVRFQGTAVDVRYGRRWHNATDQSHKQVHSVKNYLEVSGRTSPWITNLIWLRGVPNTLLPHGLHNILGEPLTWETLLSLVVQLRRPRREGNRWVLDANPRPGADSIAAAADLFTREIVPTRLDRQRVERLTSRALGTEPVLDSVGRKLTILRGRGGTGKTVRLLELAHRLSQTQDVRVLILTYNKALVADVRRLLTIMGIAPSFTEWTIQICTVHAFLHAVLRGLGVGGDEDDFLTQYEGLKDDALAYLQAGALAAEDVEALASRNPDAFGWDFVLVDEGQDWPQNERDLLLTLFPPSRVVVADGVDQLVRSTVPTDWRGPLSRREVAVVPLERCLRMKAGIARFASSVGRHLGLLYSGWEPNVELPGGRVIIVDRPYLAEREIHDGLLRANAADKNAPIDVLMCLPPVLVAQDGPDGRSRSLAAVALERWGYRTWDGAVADTREGYPTDNDQIRIVQYESCRGLEGWVVVNLALDRFFDHKRALAAGEDGVAPELEAARWVMIPLSRAIDTLVIQLDLPNSPVRDAVTAAAKECGDYVEWIGGGR